MEEETKNSNFARAIAFYLPQYHPIPENDEWWGRGFTEWRNVVNAKPLFSGHYQPHLPSDLGFYDLRLHETRQAQADIAREHGIYGFCYYHYWFNGKRLLDRPLNDVLSSGKPDFPFCLCWANENWTRAWDGHDREILISQQYSEQDDMEHIQLLAEVFKDKRYIRVDGKPLFLVYRAMLLPDPKKTCAIWREEAHRLGIGDLYLCCVESFSKERCDPRVIGFDSAVEFQPDWLNLCDPIHRNRFSYWMTRIGMLNKTFQINRVYSYPSVIQKMLQKETPGYTLFPCVTPSWDNTARRKSDAVIFKDCTPEHYGNWIKKVLEKVEFPSKEENFIFINAWNEWAEGNHLEPDQKWGLQYLEATRNSILSKNTTVRNENRHKV